MRARIFFSLLRLGPRRILQLLYHLPQFVRLFSRLLADPRVSWKPKTALLAVAVYLFIPFDVVPDFIPGLGQIDDLVLIYLGLQAFIRFCPQAIVREHVQAIAAGR